MRKNVSLILLALALASATWAAGADTCPGTAMTVPFCECDTNYGAANDHDCGTGHAGSDVVYQIDGLTVGYVYRFIGEASYDADWTIATVCDATTGDILCADRVGTQADPSCSSLTHDTWGYMVYDWTATQTSVWVWVDSYSTPGGGDYCLEVIEVGAPTPTPTIEGNDCSDPFVIDMTTWTPGSGSFTTSGDSCAYLNTYNEADYGCGSSLDSKDVVFSFTPPTDLGLQIDLIGSAFDTKLVITDGCPTAVGTCMYNDDYSGTQSGFDSTIFTGGTTYYIFIEGYSLACGSFTLNVDVGIPPTPTPLPTPCPQVTCPPEGVPEGEPDCGPEYVDIYNGGCNSSPYMFQAIQCGDVICGTSGTFLAGGSDSRDTDWYRIELTSSTELTWEIEAEFPSLIFIINGGTEDCLDYTIVNQSSLPCGLNSLTEILAPGVYWLWVGPSVFTGYDCPLDYVASLTCAVPGTPTPLPTPVGPGDDCSDPLLIDLTGWTPGGTHTYTTTGDTCAFGNQYDVVDYGCGISLLSPEVVYKFTPPVTMNLQIDVLGSLYDTKMVITDGCPTATSTCLYNDDYAGEYQSGFDCQEFTGGVTYYIFIEGYGGDCGAYTLNVDACIPATPTPLPTPCPQVTCPPEGVPEGEPDCGPDYEDTYNGGCNSSPYVFQAIQCGDVVCGTSGNFLYGTSEYRETDWYRLEVTSATYITWQVDAEFPSLLFIMNAGTEDCLDYTMLGESSLPCGINSVGASVEPGIYWLWVGPSVFSGFDCPVDYVASLTCGEPPTPTPLPTPAGQGDDCSDPFIVDMTGWTPNQPNTYTTAGDTCSFGNQYDVIDYGCGSALQSSEVVYQFTPPETMLLQIDLTGSAYDTKIVITDNCPTAAVTCLYNDDYSGLTSGFDCTEFTGGVTYYVFIEGYNSACGAYTLNVDVCVPPTPTPVPPTVTPIPTPSPTPGSPCIHDGDVNMDGVISSEDAQQAFGIAIGAITPTPEQFCAADCDGNGVISAGDAQKIFYTIFAMDTCVDPISKLTSMGKMSSSVMMLGQAGGTVWTTTQLHNSTYTVIVGLDTSAEVDAFTLNVNYNSAALTFIKGQAGDLNPEWIMFNAAATEPGVVTVAGFAFNTAIPKATEGSVVVLEFAIPDADSLFQVPQITVNNFQDDLSGYTVR